jgi:hypothetical protein
MRAAVVSLFAAGFVGSISSLANAQLIVGNDQSGVATIYNVDVITGAATPIYSSSTAEAKPWGMAYDSGSNTLYWNNGGNLYSSPLSGTLTPTLLGGMTYNSASVNFVSLGMYQGRLYGTRNIATEAVYEIDPVTRIATLVYQYPSTFDFGGLDFDDVNGSLFGLTDAGGAGLYKFDLGGQSQAFVAPYPGGETDIDGLAVHNGVAYYVTDGPNTTQANFYLYSTSTGQLVGTLPSPFTGSGTFSAATFAAIPEPASVTGMMVVAGVAVLRRRSRDASHRSA